MAVIIACDLFCVVLFELLSERRQLRFDFGEFSLQGCDDAFQPGYTIVSGRSRQVGRSMLVRRSRIAAEQMHVTCFFRSWLSWKYADQGWLSLHQALQGGLHIRQFGELKDSLAARSQFARSLGSTKQQRAHHRRLSAGEIENLLQAMFVLGDTALGAAHRASQILRVQRIERISDQRLRRGSSLDRDSISGYMH